MKRIIFLVIGLFFIMGCKKDQDEVVNPKPPGAGEQEVITTLILTCVSTSQDTVRAMFKNGDGSAGNEWQLDSLLLQSNTTYVVSITLLDESVPPKVIDVTKEIEEEKDFHQFFFDAPSMNISTQYLDMDNNNLPLGLKFNLVTGQPASGIFLVKLSHFGEAQIKDGITPRGGTDIYVEFPARVY